jgi:transposase
MIDSDTRYRSIVHYKYFLPSLRKVSKLYGVSKSSLQRWTRQNPRHAQRRRKSKNRTDIESAVQSCIASNPFVTARDVAAHVADSCNVRMSPSTACRYIKRCGFSKKKAFRMVDHKHSLDSVTDFCNNYMKADNIVCIDEAGFYVGDHGRSGYSRVGCRLRVPVGKTVRRSKFTLLFAVSNTGVVGYKVLDHNCRKADFVEFITHLDVRPMSTLVMDNIAFHHSAQTKDAIQLKKCNALYIPPYSPRCNAIENIFGALKHAYRSRCPSIVRYSAEHYKALLHDTIRDWHDKDFSPYMERTRRWIEETLQGLQTDPTRIQYFHGYD